MALKNEILDKKIIFFDGVCHLCHAFVDSMIQADQKHRFYFAPLQGETASNLLPTEMSQTLESLIYYDQGQLLQRSDAILKIFADLGGPYKLILVAKIFPLPLRDFIYQWVAKNRYRWFGKRNFCRLAQDDEKDYLLP
jgi:predicted DCC family thiol-disulfide oxidoreductase YuxK